MFLELYCILIYLIFLGISNQCSDGEYRNYINIIDDEISDDDPQLQTVIEESMTEADISNESQNVQELLTVFQSTDISSSESTSLKTSLGTMPLLQYELLIELP